jgi:hypothetical protein
MDGGTQPPGEVSAMQQAIDHLVIDAGTSDDDPVIAPLLREQLEPMMGGRRDGGVGGPERALMRAMLQDAVLCLIGEAAPAKERVRLAADARYWVESHSREWIFSFESVCEALDINPEYARRALLRMADRRAAAEAAGQGDEAKPAEKCALRSMRGLRHGGDRPRRAIHFMVERRRRRHVAASS